MDQKCVIIDCGSGKCKAGLSGKILPSIEIPTVVWHPYTNGMVTKDDESSLLFGVTDIESENGILNHPIKNKYRRIWYLYNRGPPHSERFKRKINKNAI